MRLIVKDNNFLGYDIDPLVREDLYRIADCRLDNLTDSDDNEVWLFPRKGDRHTDKIEDQSIISIIGNRFTTGNIMGFIGTGDTELAINSRFSPDDGPDWFMQYILQKVFAINIFDLKHGKGGDNALNISALMLPHFLQKALMQGVYREYVRREHNDSNPKGAININAHIKSNYPFKNGKIAYTTREYTYDNSITQLIRHTIEFLRSDKMTWGILHSNPETQANIKQIINATPTYRKGDLSKVLLANAKPKIHPYYSEYQPLQKLCLQILKRKKLSYGESKERIYGVLFDGAWLWEEYLNLTMSKAGFTHPENKKGTHKLYPFKAKERYARYPDFVHTHIIADAKYKKLIKLKDEQGHIYEGIDRNDLNQMISYMHITSSSRGIFICPTIIDVMNLDTGEFYEDDEFVIREEKLFLYKVGELNGHGGEIMILGVNVPSFAKTYEEFIEKMHTTESILLETLNKVVRT